MIDDRCVDQAGEARMDVVREKRRGCEVGAGVKGTEISSTDWIPVCGPEAGSGPVMESVRRSGWSGRPTEDLPPAHAP